MKFWHLTDIHLDYYYDAKGNAGDWCHLTPEYVTQTKPNKKVDGIFGDYRCDGTQILTNAAIDTMQIIEPSPDIILWTGDSSPHWKYPTPPDWNYIFKAERDIVRRLRNNFPNSTILPVLGNHDSFPPYSFPGILLIK